MEAIDRVAAYGKVFPEYPPLCCHEDRWVYGIWMVGSNYRRTNDLYGAYPPSYLRRVHSMFPDARTVLHLFSGGLTLDDATATWFSAVADEANWTYDRQNEFQMDLVDSKGPDEGRFPTWQGDVTALPEEWSDRFDLVLADPPYSKADAEKYGVKMPSATKVLREAARVTRPGGNLVWLDQKLPMYRKVDWKLWGTVGLIRSTNHRMRLVSMYRKT